MEKFKSGKLAQAMSKLIKSPLAKKLTNNPAYHSIGKPAFSGGIDSIKNASLLDGIMIGASIGGSWGAGVLIEKSCLNFFVPNWDKKLKEGFNGLYDKVANSDFGKGVTNTVNSVKQIVGNAIHNEEKVVRNFISDSVKKFFANDPKLGWLG